MTKRPIEIIQECRINLINIFTLICETVINTDPPNITSATSNTQINVVEYGGRDRKDLINRKIRSKKSQLKIRKQYCKMDDPVIFRKNEIMSYREEAKRFRESLGQRQRRMIELFNQKANNSPVSLAKIASRNFGKKR